MNIITRCLSSLTTPNLNAVNNESKTPLAYCSYEVLAQLNLQEGLAVVVNKMIPFDNNTLLTSGRLSLPNERSNSRANTGLFHQD